MIDLHTHTTISDGTLSPQELVQTAAKAGLSAVAITDHDSVDGLYQAELEAEKLKNIKLIKGIEFSAAYGKKRLIHILGLGIEPQSRGFEKIYSEYRKERSQKLEFVFRELQSMGVDIQRDRLQPHTAGVYSDRMAVARYLVAENYAPDMTHAWMNYLDHIPYFPGELITPEKAFSAIHTAGGKSFLAHFHLPIGLNGYSEEESRSHLKELKRVGLDGMEYYYPSFTEKERELCGRYIREFDFIRSGGTDFHGANRPHIKLGRGEGNFRVPEVLLNDILPF